jgi:hypothetical protein
MSTAYSTEKAERDFFSEAREHAAAMEQHLSTSGSPTMAYRHEELEAYLQREGREWLRRMAQAHLLLRAALEPPVEVRGADEVRRGYGSPDARRPLRLVFGNVEALRLGYEGRGVEALHPLDPALNLP